MKLMANSCSFVPLRDIGVLLASGVLTAAMLAACQSGPSAIQVAYQPEQNIQQAAEAAGLDEQEPTVQIYRTQSGYVLSDFMTAGPLAMFGVPPDDVQQLADGLPHGATQASGTWTAVGFDEQTPEQISLRYKGWLVALRPATVMTANMREIRKGSRSRAQLDSAALEPGQVIFLDGKGRLLVFTLHEQIGELLKARELDLPYRVVPGANPLVEFQTARGNVIVELFEDVAPVTTGSFLATIEKEYWAHACNAYRVAPFTKRDGGAFINIAQCGNPDGGRQWSFNMEANTEQHQRGTIAMVNIDRFSLPGHVFFNLDVEPIKSWYTEHTVFGQVLGAKSGFDLEKLSRGTVAPSSNSGLEVLDSLRPGDGIKNVRVIRQSRVSYLNMLKADEE